MDERLGALTLPPPPADLSPRRRSARAPNGSAWRASATRWGRSTCAPRSRRRSSSAEIATIVAERDELGTAIAKLRGGIGHLNREGRERLAAGVPGRWTGTSRRCSPACSAAAAAHLALVGSDDPLQAGLEIYAQPPGKKLATLSLLSGGEQALTALSLIFAVFRCNPAPLCVLDEVDAPLDDANVERFCTLLADMVGDTGTRFLVVTHHHLTMARMDRLYGVTMQERGVSRLLSVDLGAAVEWSRRWRRSRSALRRMRRQDQPDRRPVLRLHRQLRAELARQAFDDREPGRALRLAGSRRAPGRCRHRRR